MTEELKLVVELFGRVTDGALTGAVVYLGFELVKTLVPWGVGAWLGGKLIDRLPKFKKKEMV